jgi:hypothetical protein
MLLLADSVSRDGYSGNRDWRRSVSVVKKLVAKQVHYGVSLVNQRVKRFTQWLWMNKRSLAGYYCHVSHIAQLSNEMALMKGSCNINVKPTL